MFNKYAMALSQYMKQLLGDHFDRNADAVERAGHALVTEADLRAFMAMEVDLYELAYRKATEDCQEHLRRQGVVVEIR